MNTASIRVGVTVAVRVGVRVDVLFIRGAYSRRMQSRPVDA